MIRALLERLRQGHRTVAYPPPPTAVSDRFRGRPAIDASRCPEGCAACRESCPVGAIEGEAGPRIDLGLCLFCGDCRRACPHGCIDFTPEWRLGTRRREDLLTADGHLPPIVPLEKRMKRLLGRSLRLRQVSAGGCNACEADANVLTTVGFDLSSYGIGFVASPRHADGLLVTGPVTANMELALRKTWAAVPEPRIVIASGACAIGGGPYRGHPECRDGVGGILPVDLWVPGCPPHPLTLLDAVLGLLGRLEG